MGPWWEQGVAGHRLEAGLQLWSRRALRAGTPGRRDPSYRVCRQEVQREWGMGDQGQLPRFERGP